MAQGRVGACDKFAGTDLYAEFAPRLSLSRLTGRSIGFGPVKDFLVAGQVNLLLVPQLRLDLGALWDWPGRLEAGVEYSYWRNKFGIDGVVESVVQPMVKWTL